MAYKEEFHQLVSDTLRFLNVEKKPAPLLPKKVEPRVEISKPPEKVEPMQTLIKKHLSHIRFTEGPPPIPQVAILVFDKNDLPFLKNLARAIQERFCPVKLLDGEKWSHTTSYCFVISQKQVAGKEDILLQPTSFYQSNVEAKKKLWNQICQKLSQKLS